MKTKLSEVVGALLSILLATALIFGFSGKAFPQDTKQDTKTKKSNYSYNGWVEHTFYPVNDEHGIFATTEVYQEVSYKKVFIFIQPKLAFANDFQKSTRNGRTYITDIDLGAMAYFSDFWAGIGYRWQANFDISLVYGVQRQANGYTGDVTGIRFRVTW